MATILYILLAIAGIASLVCWIMVLIKIFQNAGVGLGILGIVCGIFALVYGWIKAAEWDIKNIMLIWTIITVVSIVLQVILTTVVGTSMM